jgi:hypothetical protein
MSIGHRAAWINLYDAEHTKRFPRANTKYQEIRTMDTVNRSLGEREDGVTSAIETRTAKIPSSGYLAAAIGAMGASALLKILGKNDWALFVGQWAPAFLIMGVYNKIVKQHGSDVYSKAA